MWLMPSTERSRMEAWEMSLPFKVILPPLIFSRPVSAETNSVCPLPSMPARQTISPARTSKETSDTALFLWMREGTVTPSTRNTVSPGSAGAFSTLNSTSRPTIMRESSSLVVEAMSTVPTQRPLRSTVQRSATAMISLSLWVIKRMDLPSAANERMISISSSISCGVSTAVGSSRMRISLSR